jgi:hemerythrin
MKWSPAYATGVESIDEQHQLLFKMSDDYRAALEQGQGDQVYELVLEFLDSFARAHFGHEEQCMERWRCPVAAQNIAAHGRFVDRVQEFQQRYAQRGFSQSDADQLVDFIDTWLAAHIARIDIQLKDCAPTGAS